MNKVLNQAQILLCRIGGIALHVAGYDDTYYADASTPKSVRTRGRVGGGTYGKNIQAHFDKVRFDKRPTA